MQADGGSSPQRIHLWVRKVVVESAGLVPVQKKGRRDMGWAQHEDGKIGEDYMERHKSPFLSEVIAKSMWRTLGCEKRSKAVLDSMQHIYAWRSRCWWRNKKALSMMVDPNNRTRWKHKWSWHNRGCVSGTSQRLDALETRTGSRRGESTRADWT